MLSLFFQTGVKCVHARVSLLLQEIKPALLFATNEYTSLFPVGREIQIFEFLLVFLLVKLDASFVKMFVSARKPCDWFFALVSHQKR
jgi:hypothetical protein